MSCFSVRTEGVNDELSVGNEGEGEVKESVFQPRQTENETRMGSNVMEREKTKG